MSTEIQLHGGLDLAVIQPLGELASQIARTEFVPTALRGKPEAILACMLTGQELGIPPMQALRQIHVIEGRPAQSAELMRSMVLQAGHEIFPGEDQEYSTSRVVMYGRRKGTSTTVKVVWTIEMARQAGLEGRPNWKKHPRQMLMARATSELCRGLFADVISGMGYTVEELQDGDVLDVTGEEVTESTPAKKRTVQKKPRSTTPIEPIPEPPLPDEEETVKPEVITVDAEATEAPTDNPDEWDGEKWREYLKAHGSKPVQVLRHAHELTQGTEQEAPGTLDDIAASGLAHQLKQFVDQS